MPIADRYREFAFAFRERFPSGLTPRRLALSSRVLQAMESVPRRDFLPPESRELARRDTAILIGHEQTNSQPTTVARMITLLNVESGHRVLDVGCGSGWTTALLGDITGPRGQVIGVELIPELVEFGRGNVASLNMGWTSILQGSASPVGAPELGPFDRILVSADPGADIPDELVDQLVEGGLMVIPLAGRLSVVTRGPGGSLRVRKYGYYPFVPLHTRDE